jgi:fatty acid desaturase
LDDHHDRGGRPMNAEPEKKPTLEYDAQQARRSWAQRRRDKIVAEIERNRRGEYRVPTWVLVVLLVAIVAGWAALIIFS